MNDVLFRPTILLSVAAATLSLLSGCATVTTGTDQSITVSTTPDAAKCILTREGMMIGAISSTPGTIPIDKSRNPIQIDCQKEGHAKASEVLDSEFQGATLGNILIGGVIGIAVDAGSGAMNKYPSSVELVLYPEQFNSDEARDEFFDSVSEKLQLRKQAALDAVDTQCGDNETECQRLQEKVEKDYSQKQQNLETKRAEAVVVHKVETLTSDAS